MSIREKMTIQVNCNHTNLLALLVQVVDSLTSWLCSRTHQDDDVRSILSTIGVEELDESETLILTADTVVIAPTAGEQNSTPFLSEASEEVSLTAFIFFT